VDDSEPEDVDMEVAALLQGELDLAMEPTTKFPHLDKPEFVTRCVDLAGAIKPVMPSEQWSLRQKETEQKLSKAQKERIKNLIKKKPAAAAAAPDGPPLPEAAAGAAAAEPAAKAAAGAKASMEALYGSRLSELPDEAKPQGNVAGAHSYTLNKAGKAPIIVRVREMAYYVLPVKEGHPKLTEGRAKPLSLNKHKGCNIAWRPNGGPSEAWRLAKALADW